MDTISEISLETKGWITSSAKRMRESHPDDLIDAWEKGVLRGLDLKDKIIQQYFKEKLNKALNAATQLFNILNKEIEIGCKEIFCKINNVRDFDFLYLVDFNSYLSEKPKNGFNEAKKVKKECKNMDLGFNFIFKPLTKHTNRDNIYADGYVLRYAPGSRKT